MCKYLCEWLYFYYTISWIVCHVPYIITHINISENEWNCADNCRIFKLAQFAEISRWPDFTSELQPSVLQILLCMHAVWTWFIHRTYCSSLHDLKYTIRVYLLFSKSHAALNCMLKLHVLKFIGYIGFFCKNSITK